MRSGASNSNHEERESLILMEGGTATAIAGTAAADAKDEKSGSSFSIDSTCDEADADGQNEEAAKPMFAASNHPQNKRVLLSQRIKAIRPEVINCLSFTGVFCKLLRNPERSMNRTLFLFTGAIIILIDLYFTYCQWMLQTSHSIPVLSTKHLAAGHRRLLNSRSKDDSSSSLASTVSFASIRWSSSMNTDVLDDLLSDLPQSIWVVGYLFNYEFSMIALTCATHSMFSIMEGLFRLRTD
mmetsp:Transcript_9673/g.26337  ORF Transcript_9673/g.26337 Transcript_9673/m.26337 type:complete len:240 (-) Transcript_9673:402-1121(-)|eukprot:CAMPEP_0198115688 /NCGR_PEP_ID=MMETSP1442-20131203/6704_1 /TAXON_ID= /ORGANISM="Craspedostauros australis, Strain CCMP3328" /LENGTH=239 /DNA_ID=CAMNT_0043773237 /DNA_START=1761 /DNA_END=2480 /DNA_ORIENTATION=-